jgi:hypothetical protein
VRALHHEFSISERRRGIVLSPSPSTVLGPELEENIMSRGLAFLVSLIVFWHAAANALTLTVARIPPL